MMKWWQRGGGGGFQRPYLEDSNEGTDPPCDTGVVSYDRTAGNARSSELPNSILPRTNINSCLLA